MTMRLIVAVLAALPLLVGGCSKEHSNQNTAESAKPGSSTQENPAAKSSGPAESTTLVQATPAQPTDRLLDQGFSKNEADRIASLIAAFEANVPKPERPATEQSDKALAAAGASLMAFGDRLVPYLEARSSRASRAGDASTADVYKALIEAMKDKTRTGSGGRSRATSHSKQPAEVVAKAGDVSIKVNVPAEWTRIDAPLPEARQAVLTLERREAERSLAWIAFSVEKINLRKGDPQYAEYSRFMDTRISPFGASDGLPGNWPVGERKYSQLAWTPTRKLDGTGLRAQTSVLRNWDENVRFEILEIVLDDGAMFAFGDFVYKADVTRDGRELFPK